jgi:Ca2+-binding EF-hand superfamily protein
LQLWVAQFEQLDRNRDGLLTPNELPLVASLTLKRSDTRFEITPAGSRSLVEPTLGGDWFNAMDTNQDGTISGEEFLGESSDFNGWDRDQDRFLSRGEVYFPKASN